MPTRIRAVTVRLSASMTSTVSAGVFATKTLPPATAIGAAWGFMKVRWPTSSGTASVASRCARSNGAGRLGAAFPVRASREPWCGWDTASAKRPIPATRIPVCSPIGVRSKRSSSYTCRVSLRANGSLPDLLRPENER